LLGDGNPLHADPEAARALGLRRPILHGLATLGFASRHVIAALCDHDPTRLQHVRARFSGIVFPGETLQTEMWRDDEKRIRFRTGVKERGVAVLEGGVAERS
jgi:acyl dehydratase